MSTRGRVSRREYKGIVLWNYRGDPYWHFVYRGVKYKRTSIGEAERLITDLMIAVTREIPEEEPIEEEEVIDEDEEIRPPRPIPEDEEPEDDEEPEEPDIPTLELPSLPWYAAWLQPVLTYIGSLSEAVVNFFAPIFSPIQDAANAIFDLPSSIILTVQDKIGDIIGASQGKGIDIASKTLSDIAEGTPPWMKDVEKTLEGMVSTLLESYNTAVNVETYEESMLTGEKAVGALTDLKNKVLAVAVANFVIHALVESGSLGQMEFFKELDSIVTSKFGLQALIEKATMLPIEKAILIPAEYEFNTRHPHTIPSSSELINMVVKEVIDFDDFKVEMLKLGFSEKWSAYIWDAHFTAPDWGELRNAFYRGEISREELDTLKILVDLDPRYNKIWDAQIEQIPPYSELVNERVKEVLDAEDFEKYLQWYGFNKEWAKRIWDAHFTPPSLGDLLTAWRRGEITEERLDELMILVDLDPRFKAIFDTRKYIDPSITLARYMFETGAIDGERVKEIVARAGHLPEDIEPIANFIVRFQERRYRTRYLVALTTGITAGAYTEDELKEAVKEAGYTEETAVWMIKIAEVRKKIRETKAPSTKAKILSLGDLKKAFMRDEITEDELNTELLTRGYEIGDIDLMITLLKGDKVTTEAGGRKIALSQTELLNAWRYEEYTEDALRIELSLRGLAQDEIEILLNTKKKQWGLEA